MGELSKVAETGSEFASETEGQSRRLESLDALRGLDMLLLLGLAGLFRELAPLLPAPFGPCLAAHMTHAHWGACYVLNSAIQFLNIFI